MEEIPTPEVFVVASYETDYRPIMRLPPTYLRSACPPSAPRRLPDTLHPTDARCRAMRSPDQP